MAIIGTMAGHVNGKKSISEAELRKLVTPLRPKYDDRDDIDTSMPWVWIQSGVLQDRFLLVLDVCAIPMAEERFPDATIYVMPEMKILAGFATDEEAMRTLHRLKKELCGWLMDSKR